MKAVAGIAKQFTYQIVWITGVIFATIFLLASWLSPGMVVTRGIFTSPDGKYTMRVEVHMAKRKTRTVVQEVKSGDVKADVWAERDSVGVEGLSVTWTEERGAVVKSPYGEREVRW